MLTNERANLIGNYLAADKERALALLELSPEDATAKINSDGYDFTVGEIAEFGNQMKTSVAVPQEGELSEDVLDGISGGLVVEGVAIACISLGFSIGSAIAKNWGW